MLVTKIDLKGLQYFRKINYTTLIPHWYDSFIFVSSNQQTRSRSSASQFRGDGCALSLIPIRGETAAVLP